MEILSTIYPSFAKEGINIVDGGNLHFSAYMCGSFEVKTDIIAVVASPRSSCDTSDNVCLDFKTDVTVFISNVLCVGHYTD